MRAKVSPATLSRAYAALFKAWGADYAGADACKQGEALGLRCRVARSGLDELRELNRPAVLTMHDAQGREFHATLLALDEKGASFGIGANSAPGTIVQPSATGYVRVRLDPVFLIASVLADVGGYYGLGSGGGVWSVTLGGGAAIP